MLDPRFAILGAAIDVIGCAHYALLTIKGNTKPNRVTWLLWTTISFIAFAAEIQQGVGFVSLLTFAAGFGPGLVLAASFVNRQSYWHISRLDLACGGLSVLAIILWVSTRTGNIAIIFAITADLLASVPTIIKSYRFPGTESPVTYGLAIIAAIITMATLTKFDLPNLGYPLYILLDCTVLFTLIKFPNLRPHHAYSAKPN
jgi:hypothetical protein